MPVVSVVYVAIASKQKFESMDKRKLKTIRIKTALLGCNWQQIYGKKAANSNLINFIATVIAVGHFLIWI